jgi:malate dehydrogenase (oxaloacetate-decarboxylating)(NADP+)
MWMFLPGQVNNFSIFPAVGMAIFNTQAKRVTDEMFIEAEQAVADQVPARLRELLNSSSMLIRLNSKL